MSSDPKRAPRPVPDTDILEKELLQLISENLIEPATGFNTRSNLYEAGLDSMGIMQLLILIEKRYGVLLPESALCRKNFDDIVGLAKIVRAKLLQHAELAD